MFRSIKPNLPDGNAALLAEAKQRIGALEGQVLDAYEVAAFLYEGNLQHSDRLLDAYEAITMLYEMILGGA